MGRDPLIIFDLLCLCRIWKTVGERVVELYGLFRYVPSRVSTFTWEKVLVRLEMKYVMENDETSMSPELTQDHSGDV